MYRKMIVLTSSHFIRYVGICYSFYFFSVVKAIQMSIVIAVSGIAEALDESDCYKLPIRKA